MRDHLATHLVTALCCLSVVGACSPPGPGNTNSSQSTARGTVGSRTNGSATGQTGGSAETNGSGGNTTGSGVTNGGGSGGSVVCQSACNLPGQFCDDGGQCVVCLGNDQCKSSEQSICFLGLGPYYGTCVQCEKASQCSNGEACNAEHNCVPGCLQTDSCADATPFCEPDAGVCVQCLSATVCSGGLVCAEGACSQCTSDYECSMNYANLWICSPESNCVQCRVDQDCPEGEHCVGTGCK
jgi:hypothetical protein